MRTLNLFSARGSSVPGGTAWYLAELGEFKGKQELFAHQAPQRLKALREHALVESAISSNRLEGVEVDPKRVPKLLGAATPLFRDRDEEEVRGYREALTLLHAEARDLVVSEETLQRLHRLTRGQLWDAGQYKAQDSDIIERDPDGRQRIRFRTVPAAGTPQAMADLISAWQACLVERWIHPLIALAAFNLDFLCIHPFRDGNGRVSRLVLLLQCYQLGYEVGRYISLERLIEQNKDRYYETLEQSSQGWHEGAHDPWPYLNFVLFVLRSAYREFVERVGDPRAPRGSKTETVVAAIEQLPQKFTLAQVQQACPDVSFETVRNVLREMRGTTVESVGRGPGAYWLKKG